MSFFFCPFSSFSVPQSAALCLGGTRTNSRRCTRLSPAFCPCCHRTCISCPSTAATPPCSSLMEGTSSRLMGRTISIILSEDQSRACVSCMRTWTIGGRARLTVPLRFKVELTSFVGIMSGPSRGSTSSLPELLKRQMP